MEYNLSKPYKNYELIINSKYDYLYDNDQFGHEVLKARLFENDEAYLFIDKYNLKDVYVIPLTNDTMNFSEIYYPFLMDEEYVDGEKQYDELFDLFYKINNHLIKHDRLVKEEDNSDEQKRAYLNQLKCIDDLF